MRSLCAALALLLSAASVPAQAQAQTNTYPSRVVRVIVPFAAGSGADVITRMITRRLQEGLKQSFVVDNRPGAGAMIGVEATAKAAPDGYTLVYASNTSLAAAPHLFKSVPYNPSTDILPIAVAGFLPTVMLTLPSFPAKTLPEFIAYAKKKPGEITYAHAHATGLAAGASLRMFAKIDMVEVPYKSSPQALGDLIAGQVQVYFADIVSAMPMIREGRVRVLGVSTDKRAAALPDVPTFAETLPGVDGIFGWGVIAGPANVPAPIVKRINAEVNRVMKTPELKEFMGKIGADWMEGSPEQVKAFVDSEIKKWERVLKAAGVKPAG